MGVYFNIFITFNNDDNVNKNPATKCISNTPLSSLLLIHKPLFVILYKDVSFSKNNSGKIVHPLICKYPM